MVTGKLGRHSQVGYPAAAILLCFFSKDLRFAFNLWMALGGMVVPQLAATSVCPGFFLPGLTGMRFANWRQQNQNEIDWDDTRLVRRASALITARS
jgi:hypothetical protein